MKQRTETSHQATNKPTAGHSLSDIGTQPKHLQGLRLPMLGASLLAVLLAGCAVEVDGQASEKQLGTIYWQQFTIPFTATSDLATVSLRRVPSQKFDNLLKGKVWLDGFTLSEVR